MKIQLSSNILKNLFQNVYFINGTACAGKSTMVKLLAEKYDGICCGENYHMELIALAEPRYQPDLCYMETMSSWEEFLSRTPEEYDRWITSTGREAAELEIIRLIGLAAQGKRVFVDTNIPVDILRQISDYHHVAIMLAPGEMSVNRFFDRPDPEKQFLYRELMKFPNPEAAMENFRRCLERINSHAHYEEFAGSGFFTYVRTSESTIDDTLKILEQHFMLNEST